MAANGKYRDFYFRCAFKNRREYACIAAFTLEGAVKRLRAMGAKSIGPCPEEDYLRYNSPKPDKGFIETTVIF